MTGDKDKLDTGQGEDDMTQKVIAGQIVVEYVNKVDNLLKQIEEETFQAQTELVKTEMDKDLFRKLGENYDSLWTIRYRLSNLKEHAEMREKM